MPTIAYSPETIAAARKYVSLLLKKYDGSEQSLAVVFANFAADSAHESPNPELISLISVLLAEKITSYRKNLN